MDNRTNPTRIKFIFIGDQKVGKSSIINCFMYYSFDPNYKATLSIDYLSKTLHLDGRTARLQVWDTPGQERFKCLIQNYIRDSSVAVVVFDITDKQTFVNCDKWVELVKIERGNDFLIFLIGNKIDQIKERAVSFDEALTKSIDLNAIYIETSAESKEIGFFYEMMLGVTWIFCE